MQKLVLTGRDLTIAQVAAVAREGVPVEIDPAVCASLEATRRMVLEMAGDRTLPRIYGFNTGLGMNKDWDISVEGLEKFNRGVIFSHSNAIPPEMEEEEVRATLLVRLNCFLSNATGAQPELIYRYRDFLNLHLYPVLCKRGSIGESDLAILAHVGLTIIGEGEANYQGVRMPAAEALEKAGLKPLRLGCKDGLAIVNSNAVSAGLGALVLQDVRDFLDMLDLVYALSLEGYGGNTSPICPEPYRYRPAAGPSRCAARVRRFLEGSFIWQPGVAVTLQDPLCFRSACHVNGAARDALDFVTPHLVGHLNSSDDNPCVLSEERRIVSCSNFDPTTWVLGFEMLGLALSHVSKNMCYQMIKMGTPYFSRLPRFLSPDGTSVMAYTTNQKAYTMLDAENRHLSNPVTADYFSVSGDVEDHATNAPLVVEKTAKMLDNLRYMLGIQAFHAAQAVELRRAGPLGKGTAQALSAIREVIPFLEADRVLSEDIRKGYELVRSGKLLEIAERFAG